MKKLFTILTATLLTVMLAFGLVACSPTTTPPPEGGGECQHTYEATAWFDSAHHYASKLVCSQCSDEVTRTRIEITNAQELRYLAQDLNEGIKPAGRSTFFFMNDIDLSGSAWTPINIYNEDGDAYTFKSGIDGTNINVSGITITSGENVGFFGKVESSITVDKINIVGANVAGQNASALIGAIDCSQVQSVVKQTIDVKNCSVSNCTIAGTVSAGAIYGSATGDNGGDTSYATSITIQHCSFSNNAISSNGGYAGGVAGIMSDYSGEVIKGVLVKISDSTFSNCTVTSTLENGAGKVIGIVGYSNGDVCSETTGSSYDNVVATGNGTVVMARPYGRTGWVDSVGSTFTYGNMFTETWSNGTH